MDKNYRIKKILNNNVVMATSGFEEVVVMGLGIGHNFKIKQIIPHDRIEKVFELKKEDFYKLVSLAKEINEDTFNIAYNIIKENEQKFNVKLDSHAYLVLIDHINFAIKRHQDGYQITNLLIDDLRLMYPDELKLAQNILEDVNSKFKVSLPKDEAGFIVMHIINGINPQLDNKSNILTDAILGCLNVIRDYYLISLKPEELSTQRILVHIKLLLQRIMMGTQVDFKEQILYNVFEDFPRAYNCALEIQKFIEKRLNAKINQQEIVYLTIHLNRLEMMSK